MYVKVMKFFIIFILLVFLVVMFYFDILCYILGCDYWVGFKVVFIVMVVEMFMGIYFNFFFWYKLIDEIKWGVYFLLVGCSIIILINIFFILVFGYMVCVWVGFVGYGVVMFFFYFVG